MQKKTDFGGEIENLQYIYLNFLNVSQLVEKC